jgi:hypothetical protein
MLVSIYKAAQLPSYASVPYWAMASQTFALREYKRVAAGGTTLLTYVPNATHP